jgi:formimidoylglutamate deiminase
MTVLHAPEALLPSGWARDVRVEMDGTGTIVSVTPQAPAAAATRLRGPVLPGLADVHSHAFQRAMAGLTEHVSRHADTFWTWREVMYTAVCEFHYLHHDPDGRPYANPAEMSERIIAAAAGAGIALTLLPVLYMTSDFGGKPPTAGQRRFLGTPDAIVAMIDTLRKAHPEVRFGLAPHSLRAVPPDALAEAVRAVDAVDPTAPVHIHAAEQEKEVADCLAWSGRRPVEWLLDAHRLGPRWCIVHATHLTAAETDALAASGATAGLCPTTEANLGDGLFPLARYLERGGRLGVGTDSNVSVSTIEELRWLEYGQRLAARRRNIAATASSPSPGATLYRAALAGGAAASGRRAAGLAPGERADLVVLDPDAPFLAGRTGDTRLDALVFGGDAQPIRDVYVGGRPVVADRRHPDETVIFDRFRRALARLGSA